MDFERPDIGGNSPKRIVQRELHAAPAGAELGSLIDSPLEGGVSCELVSKSPIPCYPGKYSELHSAAECSAG